MGICFLSSYVKAGERRAGSSRLLPIRALISPKTRRPSHSENTEGVARIRRYGRMRHDVPKEKWLIW